MNVAIVTDDNAGFPVREAERLGIFVVPMPIVIDGVERFEHKDITADEFFRLQAAGSEIHTSQPRPGDVMALWDKALARAEQLVYAPMSSGLTMSVATAQMLAKEPPYAGRVFVTDNHRISVTLRAAIYDALTLVKEGKDGREIKEYLENSAHESSIYIMVDTLKYLVKGGRVTPAGAALGSAFHIKPILTIDGGKLDAKAKALGSRNALKMMIQYIAADIKLKFKGDVSHLSLGTPYTHDITKGLEFRAQLAKALAIAPEEILIDPLSLSIAVHIGPGAIAVAATKVIDPEQVREAALLQKEYRKLPAEPLSGDEKA